MGELTTYLLPGAQGSYLVSRLGEKKPVTQDEACEAQERVSGKDNRWGQKDGEWERFEFVPLHFLQVQGASAHLLLLPIPVTMVPRADMKSTVRRAETCVR